VLNAPLVRPLKRMLRHAAPGVATKLWAWVNGQPDVVAEPGAVLAEIQRRFDLVYRIDDSVLQSVAQASSLIVIGTTPFPNVSMLVDELAQERVVLGELIIVDATAEAPRGVAIRDHVAAWRFRLPLTRITVVSYSRQELRFAGALRQGLALARNPNVWIAGRDYVPLHRTFEYLLKTFLVERQQAVVVVQTFAPNSVLERIDVPSDALADSALDALLTASDFTLLNGDAGGPADRLASLPLIAECPSFRRGIFGGAVQHLLEGLDDRFITEIAVADLSLRLRARRTKAVFSSASAAICLHHQPTDAAAPWEAIHDWRWLLEKSRETFTRNVERIELVCPFHRGDVLLAVQVAAHAASLGVQVRLHVAHELLSWVRDMSRAIDVAPIPIPVASAEDTYPQLLAAYKYVSQRPDASPRLARCHPSRDLSKTGMNLIQFMLEELGLPLDASIGNLRPSTTEEQKRIAHEVMQPFGRDIVFIHPLGGWKLKSIPAHTLVELAEHVRKAGFKLIQIGGAGDVRLEACDGTILQNFLPSQWREILVLGRALIGVDSWAAHFASILDIPQVTLYGSTHPLHVNTKRWFAERTSPSLVLGPIVNCSPCNSLTCVTFPGRNYCTGYKIDPAELNGFLSSLH
jgi:hypothetical protein